MNPPPKSRVYSVTVHDGKRAHVVECEAPTRKHVYEILKNQRIISIKFVRWVKDTPAP